MPIPTPTAWWNFETDTTTGFETDIDEVSSIPIWARGDEEALDPDASPCPTVPGKTGSGRLFASYNRFNCFSTEKVAALAYPTTNPISYTFWWRPLAEPVASGRSVFLASLFGFVGGGAIGVYAIEIAIDRGSAAGLYNFEFATFGSPFNDVPMAFQEWNLVTVTFDGTDVLSLYVNGALIGTVSLGTALTTSDLGMIRFTKEFLVNGLCIGVIDSVGIWLDHHLSSSEVLEIYNGWTYP